MRRLLLLMALLLGTIFMPFSAQAQDGGQDEDQGAVQNGSGASAPPLLTWLDENCISGTPQELDAAYTGLGVRLFATGNIQGGRLFVLVNLDTSSGYLVRVSGTETPYEACLIAGTRETDIQAIDILPQLADVWPARRNRYHFEMIQRLFDGSIPLALETIETNDALVAFSGYLVHPQFEGNRFDNPVELDAGGEKRTLSQGAFLNIANENLAKIDKNEIEATPEVRASFERMSEMVDHHYAMLFLVVDRVDNDFSVIEIRRQEKAIRELLRGTDLGMKY